MAQPADITPLEHKKTFWDRIKDSFVPWMYIAPAGILMFLITLTPQIYQIMMSFMDYRILHLRFNLFDSTTWEKFAPPFIGFDNFARIFSGDLPIQNYDFFRILLFNVVWTVANVVVHVGLGVIIALILNHKDLKLKRVYRAIFIIPWAIPGLINALIWRNMYDTQFGVINQLILWFNETLGTNLPEGIKWLTDPNPPIGGLLSFLPVAFYAVLLTNIWLGWPFMTVIATGALQSIPEELYEAAKMDGAGWWRQLMNITLPLIRPAMVPAVMVGTIWTFNNFNVIYFISEGGPFGRTELLVTQAFKLVYEQPQLYGVGAAFGIIVFFILLFITLVNNRITRSTEAYYD